MTISPDYPFESKFVDVHHSRIHYIEKGEGQIFLFLHGNPTWSYLWRNVIPRVAEYGRCIALDLIGFGKSDKPKINYKFLTHYEYIQGFIDELGLRNITFVGHNWGGVLGFYYALNHRNNVRGIAFMESFPFTLTWNYFPKDFRMVFRLFRTPVIGRFMIMIMNMFVNRLIPGSVFRGISKEIHMCYREPFPTIKSRYPVFVWPNELPIEGRENETFREIKRLEESLSEFAFPMLLLTCTPGGVIRREKIEWLKKTIRDLTITDIGHGIHFIQEDNPAGIGNGIVEWAKDKNLIQAEVPKRGV